MKKISMLITVVAVLLAVASRAQLTVEKIMQDPKWMGSSPSNPFWSWDSKQIYFSWNPKGEISDSMYRVQIPGFEPVKAGYYEAEREQAIANAVHNSNQTQLAYTYRGDVFLMDLKSHQTVRVTKTEDAEFNPRFVMNNQWLVFTRNQNLFAWNIKTGESQQLSKIIRTGEMNGSNGLVAAGGGMNGASGKTQMAMTQDQWLQQDQLASSEILRERKQKQEARDLFLKNHKENDTLKSIGIGDKQVQNLQISPDGRYISYRLYSAGANPKNTIIPNYMNESGYTADILGRTKVGNSLGKFESWIFDREKDAIYQILTDGLPGITDAPDYIKDYPQKYNGRKLTPRPVQISGLIWNDGGTAAMVDIRSQDNKDRWICYLKPDNGRLIPIDRQRDEAWIGGPGIGGAGNGATMGWINEDEIYYQSEKSGYSHIYIYNIKHLVEKPSVRGIMRYKIWC